MIIFWSLAVSKSFKHCNWQQQHHVRTLILPQRALQPFIYSSSALRNLLLVLFLYCLFVFLSFTADWLCWSHCLAALALIRYKAERAIHFFRAFEHELFFTLDSLYLVLLHNFSQCSDHPVLQSALQPHQQCCSIDQPRLLQDRDDFMPPACHFTLPLTTRRVEVPRLFVNWYVWYSQQAGLGCKFDVFHT